MDRLKERLDQAWEKRFGRDFRADVRATKTMFSPDGRKLCEVVHSRSLEEWYQSPRGKARYDKPRCFFCEKHDEFLLLETVMRLSHLGIYFNKKFVAPCHFLISPYAEHREAPNEDDIAVLQMLAARTRLSIFGNMRDSGASYPEHVHYQSLDIVFPITARPEEETIFNSPFRLARLNYPVAAYRLSPVPRRLSGPVAKVLTRLQRPYNPLFFGGDVFVVPRVKSVPSNTGGFKFAAAEVFGCVFTRSREFYDLLTCDLMLAAMQDVCLPAGSREAGEFEQRLVQAAREVAA